MISRILFRIYLENCHLIRKSSLLCSLYLSTLYYVPKRKPDSKQLFWVFMRYKFKIPNIAEFCFCFRTSTDTISPQRQSRAANARMGGGGGSIQISTHGIGPGSNGDPRMQMLKPPIGNSKISWNRCSVSVELIHLSLSILRYLISISYSIHFNCFSDTLARIYNPYESMKMFSTFWPH